MKPIRIVAPPQPNSTVRAANAVLGKENVYVLLGDHLESILGETIIWSEMTEPSSPWNGYLRTQPVLALITLLQMVEGLTDEQVVNAIHERTDWKYALHLPMINSGIEAQSLCEFRREVIHNETARSTFQTVLQRFQQVTGDRLAPANTSVEHILNTVCWHTRLDWVVSAMTEAIDMFAFTYPDWLRNHSLPHWYSRYNHYDFRTGAWEGNNNEGKHQAIGGDAFFLLDSFEQDPLDCGEPAELRQLRITMAQQYLPQNSPMSEQPRPAPLCSFCKSSCQRG